MKEKILALLTAQHPAARKDGLNHIANALAPQVNTEDEAAAIVGKLSAGQVNSIIAEWRKETDAEISKANKTHEDGLRKKYDFAEKKQPETTPATTHAAAEATGFDAAAIQKIVSEAVATAPTDLRGNDNRHRHQRRNGFEHRPLQR
jgi:hypothetical protein